jgi:hypothetical protein
MGKHYYPDNDDMSPGAAEIAAGFNAFRYSPMGVTDNGSYPPDAETDELDPDLSVKQPAPNYDRHIK